MKKKYFLFFYVILSISLKGFSQPNPSFDRLDLYKKILFIFDSKNKFYNSPMIKISSTSKTIDDYSDTIIRKRLSFQTTNTQFNTLEYKENNSDTSLIISNGKKLKATYKKKQKITDASKVYMIFGNTLGIPTLLEALKHENTIINIENNIYKIIYNDKNKNEYIYKVNANNLILEACETPFGKTTYQNYQIINELYVPSQIIQKISTMSIILQIQEIQLFEKIDESLFIIED